MTVSEVGEEFIGPPAPAPAGRVIPKGDGLTVSEVGEEFISSEKNHNGLDPRNVFSPLVRHSRATSNKTNPLTEPPKLKWTELPGPNPGNNGVGAGPYGSEAAKINSSLKTTLAFEGSPKSETEKIDGLLLGDVGKSGTADTKPRLNQYPQVHSGYRKEPTLDQSNLTVQNSDSDRALHVQPNGAHVRMVPDGVSDLNRFDPISTADQNWSQKLVHQLHLNIINGRTNSINLQLHPASLGLLNLNVRKIGDKIEILITTQTKAAIKLLTDSQPKIALLLAESGVKLDAIRVLDESLQDNFLGSSDKDNASSNDLNERNYNHDNNLESEDKIEQAEEIEMESNNNKIVIYA